MPAEPFALLPARTRRVITASALLATAALTAALGVFDVHLRTPDAPSGIVSFELADSIAAAEKVLTSWNAEARVYAGLSLGIDFAYPLAYSTLLAMVCAWASRSGPSAWRALGRWLCWGQWLAALCDMCENIALIALLVGWRSDAWPVIASSFARSKFVLLVAGALYIIAGTLVRAFAAATTAKQAPTSQPR